MPSPTPILLALALALALATTPAAAEQVQTSKGVRTLPRSETLSTEAQYRQAVRTAEEVIAELLQDVRDADAARSNVGADATSLSEQVKKTSASLERAKAAFEVVDKKYRDDLAAFQQRQAAIEADIAQQRAQAAALQALPSAQRDMNEVNRLNEWAAKIGRERDSIEADRGRLLTDHAAVEAERAKLARQHAETEARLKVSRDGLTGEFGGAQERRNRIYAQLRIAVTYLTHARQELDRVSSIRLGRSDVYEEAKAKLTAWETRPAASR